MSCAFTLFSLSRIRLKANMFSVDGMPKGIKVLHHTANAKKNIFAVTLNIFFCSYLPFAFSILFAKNGACAGYVDAKP